MSNPFNTYLSKIQLDSLREYCLAHGERVECAKGDCFIEQGKIGRYVAYVESGLMKYTTRRNSGEEAVCGFVFAGEFSQL